MPQNYRRSFIASSTAWLGVGGFGIPIDEYDAYNYRDELLATQK